MNPAVNSNMLCNCKKFATDLLMFLKETVSDLREQQLQSKKLENSLKQYSLYKNDEVGSRVLCSQNFCALIVEELKKQDKWNGIKLLTDILAVIIGRVNAVGSCILQMCPPNGKIEDAMNDLHLPLNEDVRFMTALLDGKSDYMKLLVNLDLLPSRLKKGSIVSIRIKIMSTLLCFRAWMWEIYPSSHQGFYENYLIFKLAEKIFSFENDDANLERICLITSAILIPQLKLINKEDRAKEYLYCLRMYFTTTRDPYLTINEVRTMLYICCFIEDTLHLFELYYDEFVKMMPECSAKREPRNLTDLARCQIRESLKTCNLPLPAAVMKLNLPQQLKEFVLGDVIQITQKKGNSCMEQIITMSQLEQLVLYWWGRRNLYLKM